MKKLTIALSLLSLLAASPGARAQLVPLDTATLHTNTVVTTGATLTVAGYFFNQPYAATNPAYVTQGDSTAAAWTKINSNFSYCSNQFILLMNLPEQINTNLTADIMAVSNALLVAGAYLNANSNQWVTVSNQAVVLNSYLPSGKMHFDSGAITSDGSGNETTSGSLTAASYAGSLVDNGASSGASGYYPVANGSGAWTWTQNNVIADSAGHGGTTLHVKAQDNGADMYLHITSAGAITATASP